MKPKSRKKSIPLGIMGILLILIMNVPFNSYSQKVESGIKDYLKELPMGPVSDERQKYRMTATYLNRDLYGAFIDKVKISGDYTRGLEDGFVQWNDILVAGSNSFEEPFTAPTKQAYMEGFKYVPSSKMLDAEVFEKFPLSPEGVFARNLIWDMMAIEGFSWDYTDSLKLNGIYRIQENNEEFSMADFGTYAHAEIQLSWTGVSEMNDELCAIIEFRALDNKVEMSMGGFEAKGTEQYWGTIWISLKTKLIESAVMYSGTIQELDIPGWPEKLIVKTIRELEVEKLQ